MGRHKKRHRSPSSSSSSSGKNRKLEKKKNMKVELKQSRDRIEALEGLIRELRKNENYHRENSLDSASTSLPPVRYMGRNDFIPEFDPQKSAVSIEHWIRNLEAISKMHGWDERTLICNCTSKLRGYAKSWYEQQTSYEISWSEWKNKLIVAFPFTKNKLAQIRELVNKVRRPNENPIEFYYMKLGIGMSCELSDDLITQAIIGTLGNKLLEVGALSAGCQDTTSLLKYLASYMNSEHGHDHERTETMKSKTKTQTYRMKCFKCGQEGHKSFACRNVGNGRPERVKCSYCGNVGHAEETCFRKKNHQKYCSFCKTKGHSLDECRKHSNMLQNKTVRRVQVVSSDRSDSKYFKTVTVNESLAEAFIDFGSSCNIMKQSFCDKLSLKIVDNDTIVIKGYGDALTLPKGVATANLSVDGVKKQTEFYIVPDEVQEFDVLVGQPYTEASDIVVVKTSTQLNVFNKEMALDIAELCEKLEKVRLYPNTAVNLNPGLNKVTVRTEPIASGTLKVRQSEQRLPRGEKDILGEEIESEDGVAVIKLVNMTSEVIQLNSEECIARADLLDRHGDFDEPKIGSQLTQKERSSLESLLKEYESCFSGDGMELGNCEIEMTIKLTENKVINYKPYRISFHERDIVRQIVDDLLKAGIVEPSTSPYASPVLLVKKKEGGYRMCVDYRALNRITEKERYPLPIIQDLLDRLVDKSVFCCLDLANSYHQIRIAEPSRPLTGFITPDGHYQYRMMSFGLCNAPAVFQKAMNAILAPVIHKCAEVYIDDVIIWSENIDECLVNLRKVLELIRQAGVKLKRHKCSFLTETVEYLGHMVSGGEIRPAPHKLSAVADFRTPENVHELRQFLGLSSYFRKFIKGFATIARPLTLLTKKNVPWSWGTDQNNALETLKRLLTSDPVLTIYSPKRETQIHTDASKVGLGGVLLQRSENGEWKVVAYASRQTTATEAKYHSFELEALAVVFSIIKFKVYVSGVRFSVVTDCSALRLAWAKRDLSPRIARWWLDLQEFDFDVEHRPGASMAHVDALSRNPITTQFIEEKDFINALQDGDEEIRSLIENLRLEVEANKNKKDGLAKKFKMVNGLLCRVTDDGLRPVLPKSARWHIMKIYHDNSGHLGLEKCVEAIQAKYWFPKMKKSIDKYVASCIGCQFTKKPTGKQPGLMHAIPRVAVPFDTLHVDHLGPFCKSNGKTYIFAIIDGFTKFVWLEAVAAANTKGALTALNKLTQVFGFPVRIVSDRGTAFTGKEFKEYCEKHGIKHVLNAVASPRANGQVERLNRTILNSLTASMGTEQKGWDVHLPKVQLGINSTISQGTGKSPLELVCGLRPRLAGELRGSFYTNDLIQLRTYAAKNIEQNAVRMKDRYDKGRRVPKPIAIGSLVMVERRIMKPGLTSGKLVPRFAGPYKITAVLPNDRYEVTSAERGKRAYKNIVARDKIKEWRARCDSSSDEDNIANA